MTTTGLLPLVRGGNRPVCLMLPGAGGGVQPYLRLASHLGRTYNVYAARPAGLLPGEEPADSVAGMTDVILDALADNGLVPDLVFGWSLGGLLAWEVGQRLGEHGHHPALVIVDSAPRPRASTVDEDDRIERLIVGQLGPRADPGTIDRVARTFRAQVTALAGYRAEGTYLGRVLVQVCTPGVADEDVRRWAELAPLLSVGTLDAGHFEVFEPERLPQLITAIDAFLGREVTDAAGVR